MKTISHPVFHAIHMLYIDQITSDQITSGNICIWMFNLYYTVRPEDEELHLYQALFSNYNRKVRPRKDPNEAVDVTLQFELQGINTLVRPKIIASLIIVTWAGWDKISTLCPFCFIFYTLYFFQNDRDQTVEAVGYILAVSFYFGNNLFMLFGHIKIYRSI